MNNKTLLQRYYFDCVLNEDIIIDMSNKFSTSYIYVYHHNYPLYCVICTVCYEIDKTTLFGACYHASVMIRVNDIILF